MAVVRAHHPDADASLVEHAHDEAALWHEGQTRRSGDPYFTHCLAVAAIIAELGMPPAVVCAALLHDIDDTPCSPDRVLEHFGQDIAQLISDVHAAKFGGTPSSGLSLEAARQALHPSREEAVLAICLADRLHNMRTIAFVAPAKQYRKARETLDVLAPLAQAVGLSDVSRELHDLSLAVLQPVIPTFAITTRLLAMLTLLLPTPQRARWREEWPAELATLPTHRARTHFAFRVLLRTPSLSLTLRRPAGRERR
jgi:(p)ppGpp synthase/HD superfamily hydrolase